MGPQKEKLSLVCAKWIGGAGGFNRPQSFERIWGECCKKSLLVMGKQSQRCKDVTFATSCVDRSGDPENTLSPSVPHAPSQTSPSPQEENL